MKFNSISVSRILLSVFFVLAALVCHNLAADNHFFPSFHGIYKAPDQVLMCLSAHPDDEDGTTLAYYGKLNGAKTYSIFFTRGEGGQNETGSALGEELGNLRTKETLEAAKILGTEVYFLGFPDFGFSKTAKETFSYWGGKDSVLSRLVYIIRTLKPDVVITNHDTITARPNRQHGNHQAVGITAFEAFEKAADHNYHPEQLQNGISTWQVKKLFYRLRQDSLSTGKQLVDIDVLQKDSNGVAMNQIGVSALQKHRSQGMENLTVSTIGKRRYELIRHYGDFPFDTHDLFSGIQRSTRSIGQIDSSFVYYRPSPLLSSTKNDIGKTGKLPYKFLPDAFVGLIKTYDSTLEEFLQSYNIRYKLLDSNLLQQENLSAYSTIILDLRTYAYRPDAAKYNTRLLEYVRNGGNIVCFYHKSGDWNGKSFAPYPIQLTPERVTEEDAIVTTSSPNHILLNKPNIINPTDWNRWVQERSIYLPSEDTLQTSALYERILAMSDTDEHQPSTSLLWTHYGKGSYTYTSLVLYRQLRIMNDAAVKLFLNLISQPYAQ